MAKRIFVARQCGGGGEPLSATTDLDGGEQHAVPRAGRGGGEDFFLPLPMFSHRYFPFQLFTLAFIVAMFFPRVLPEGMFPDGLTYASIARNMAEGRGSFWSPYFSSSFWIPFQGHQYEFYGHPTLCMGLLSLLFRVVGDHWFVEKFYCILVWFATVWLVMRLWQSAGRDKQLWWLPVWTWYMMPIVLWSYPNLVLDNTMAVFSILAALFILKSIKNEKILMLHPETIGRGGKNEGISYILSFIISGLLLHLAFLTKGPVGLFPLAIPVIYRLFYRDKISLQNAVFRSLILGISCFGTLALWYFYAPARAFWLKYFNTQLVSSISDNDQTEAYTWLDYLYIPKEILVQSVAFLIVGLVLFVFSKVKKTAFQFEHEATKKAAFFTTIGLSGSLPMMVSHKASSYFLLPALPFFVVGFCLWLEPTVAIWVEKFALSPTKSLRANRFVGVVAVSVLLYCTAQIGRVGREQNLIHDAKILRGGIPLDVKIAVSDSMMKHFNYHGYFQRYNRWELTKPSDSTAHFFIDETGVSRPTELDSVVRVWGFKKVDIEGLERFIVYKRGNLVKN